MLMDIVEGKWTIMNMNERIWNIWTFVGTFKNEIFFRTFLNVRKKLMWMSKIVFTSPFNKWKAFINKGLGIYFPYASISIHNIKLWSFLNMISRPSSLWTTGVVLKLIILILNFFANMKGS